MEKTYVLWGKFENEADWEERIIIETTDEHKFKYVIEWAKKKGFINLRQKVYTEIERPDFVSAINIK
jgi:hypothetical protein